MSNPSPDASTAGSVSSAISNGVVRLLSDYTGRGPTQARTYVDENLVTTVLQDTLTKGERSLVRNGQTDLVLANRKAYQNAMGPDLVALVEEISARKVVAFLSDNHIDPDYAVESFVLAPRGGGMGAEQNGRNTSI